MENEMLFFARFPDQGVQPGGVVIEAETLTSARSKLIGHYRHIGDAHNPIIPELLKDLKEEDGRNGVFMFFIR